MGRIAFETTYSTIGEYYSPLCILKMMTSKYKSFNLYLFLFPIRLIIFIFTFALSLINLPFYFINKLLYYFNQFADDHPLFLYFIQLIVNVGYFISYWIYKIIIIISIPFVLIYENFPPKSVYIPPISVINSEDF